MTPILSRAHPSAIGIESTLFIHGLPREQSPALAQRLAETAASHHASLAIIGVLAGRPIVGINADELRTLLESSHVPKINTANLGLAMHAGSHGAATVSAAIELAAAAGLRIIATGGIGGVHHPHHAAIDISADLAALARHPVAVVCSGPKSLLDVLSTRELLETLGVPVVGYQTDRFPAFYLRDGGTDVDARFDDPADLAKFINRELARSGRGVLVANPIPASHAIEPNVMRAWLDEAQRRAAGAQGRDLTPALLRELHVISQGATLAANLALVEANVALAARLCSAAAKHVLSCP